MYFDEASRATGRFNLDRANEQRSGDVDHPESTPSLIDLDMRQTKPLTVDVALRGLTPTSNGSQGSGGTSRFEELQERLQARTLEIPASEEEPTSTKGENHSTMRPGWIISRSQGYPTAPFT